MKRSRTLNRRSVLSALAAAPLISCGRSEAEHRFLTPAEARALSAFCDRLIPPDGAPGASRAGVVHYIDIQLTRRFKRFQPVYQTGLASLDDAARRGHGSAFAALDVAAQTALLEAMEQGKDKPFFELVLAHTMQGFYGSPRHGGNRDGVSWTMLGVPNPPVRGRLHYEV
ncbi:MAG: gluconate 2-dehydrogenase subunit 3 family protein [Bryobacteraceae bacterium]